MKYPQAYNILAGIHLGIESTLNGERILLKQIFNNTVKRYRLHFFGLSVMKSVMNFRPKLAHGVVGVLPFHM
jgi:hypothetical protein